LFIRKCIPLGKYLYFCLLHPNMVGTVSLRSYNVVVAKIGCNQ
jgi:hypothetical protein